MKEDIYAQSAGTSSIAAQLLQQTNVRDILVEMMSRTNKTGVEHGIVLLHGDDGLVSTPIQSGRNGSITLTYTGRPLATAHTHPDEQYERLFSYQDIRSYINGPMEFAYLVYDDGDEAIADIYKTNKYNTFGELIQDHNKSLPALKDINAELLQETIPLNQIQ